MPAVLELIVVPTILLTLIAVLLLKTSFSTASVLATAVFLGLLYFAIIRLLRWMRRWDHDQQVSSHDAFEQAMREGEQAERDREQAEREAHRPA